MVFFFNFHGLTLGLGAGEEDMAVCASQFPQNLMSLYPTPSSPFPLGQAQSFELQCWLF